ncbi:MAG: hypothetical protein J5940_05850 [Clostridia bacterium]|nr:hypothetical protein [Clostridia bacterium]
MDRQSKNDKSAKKIILTIIVAVLVLISLVFSVKEIIGKITYYENAADAYLAEPFHSLPENIYYDTVISQIDTIMLSKSDALWIAVVKPYHTPSADKEYIIVTHMSVKNGKYLHNDSFTVLYNPSAEHRVNESGINTGISNKLSSGKNVRYDLYLRDQTVDPSFVGAERREYTVTYEGKEYAICFYYVME